MTYIKRIALALTAAATLAGCSDNMTELHAKVDEIKARPGGRIEPLPEVKPYETFTYAAANQRSPFVAGMPASATATTGVRPDQNRPREFLEQFSLDTLKMVGTLAMGGRNFGLVQTKDGLVYRVLPGNYIGQNDGKVDSVTASRISVTEIVPDGLGGYTERAAFLTLND